MTRIPAFDGIRGVAVLMIVTCHVCYGAGLGVWGQYLGGTFNTVFFLLSAILLGIVNKPENGGGKTSLHPFLFKRWLRLAASLYPFLVICTLLYVLTGVSFSVKDLILNFLMLGWIGKLPGLGHLWFVTMIVACYVLFAALRQRPERFRHPVVWLLFLPLSCAIDALNLPGYSCRVLMYCGLTFLYADNVMHWCHTVRMVWLMIGAVTVNAGVFFGIAGGILQVGHPSYYYATACAGITAFLLLFRMFIYIRPGRFLCTASTISYELYLVHHLFCLGEYSWFVRWPSVSPLYVSLFVFVASSVGAWFLHEISRRIVLSIQKRCTA